MHPSGGKRLEIIEEAVPSLSRLAVLLRRPEIGQDGIRNCEPGVRRTNTTFEFGNADELEHAFQAVLRMRPNGLIVIAGPETNFGRKQNHSIRFSEWFPGNFPQRCT